MRWNPRLFRLCTSVAVTALLAEAILPAQLLAQTAPPPLPSAQDDASAPADLTQPDPPERVGRIARITGTASFHNQGDTQWSPVSVNFPVSAGNAFWTEPNARMQMEISDSQIAMAGATEFDVHTLDQTGLQGIAARGEVYLDLRNIGSDEAWIVQTPRGLVRLNGNGRYAITVGTTDDPTLVTVLEGSASVESTNLNLTVEPNQAASLTGTDTFQGVIVPAQRDAFLTEMLGRDRPPPARLPPQVAETITAMPGGGDLASVGSWSDAPEYGQVWYPPVDPGWVPYRHGHWAYVAPWGWTWIDDASWGFAPFHYGRWVELGGRWAWTPGAVVVHERPVYAPALVAFIGLGAGVAIGAALASGSVGWVPLGPREPYHPWYHASPNYVRQVNVSHVTNITNINNVTVNNFVNRGAATSVPAAAMAGSRPIAAVARPVSAQQLATARPVFGQQPLRPTATTMGVTPATAQRLNIAPPVGGRPGAPGPVIRPTTAGARGPEAPRGPLPGQPGAPGGALGPAIRPGGPVIGAGLQAPGFARPGAPGSAVPPGASPGAQAPRPGQPPLAVHPANTPNQPGPVTNAPNMTNAGAPHMGMPQGQPRFNVPQQPGVPQQHVNAMPQQNAQQPHFNAAPQPIAPQQHFNAPPPAMPQVRAAPPMQAAPQPHFNPPPQAQPHFQPPPQQAAAQPRPAPQPHFNPPPQQHAGPPPAHQNPPPAQDHQKRPGER
jgi:hypothetical protein